MPDGGVERVVRGEFASKFFDERPAKFDGIPFDDDIEVFDRAAKQQVTDEAADYVTGKTQRCGLGGNVREESLLFGRDQVRVTQEAEHVILLHKINFTLIIQPMLMNPNPSPRMCKPSRSG